MGKRKVVDVVTGVSGAIVVARFMQVELALGFSKVIFLDVKGIGGI